jgi:hypothetical protein
MIQSLLIWGVPLATFAVIVYIIILVRKVEKKRAQKSAAELIGAPWPKRHGDADRKNPGDPGPELGQ